MMFSEASDMIGIDLSSMVTAFLSASTASETVHGSPRAGKSWDFNEIVSVPEHAR
jgi:hypothetical protein